MKATRFNFKRLAITAFIIYAAITLINQQIAIGKLMQVQQEKQKKIASIKLENEKLTKAIEQAATTEYIEKMAREQLGLVKPGEKVYINQSVQQDNPKTQGQDN